MHPFNFTSKIFFVCADPDSAFVFEPGNNKFHWYGKELDKLGRYSVEQTTQLYLELEWNYGREQSYLVVSFEDSNDSMTAFILKNTKTGKRYSFHR